MLLDLHNENYAFEICSGDNVDDDTNDANKADDWKKKSLNGPVKLLNHPNLLLLHLENVHLDKLRQKT